MLFDHSKESIFPAHYFFVYYALFFLYFQYILFDFDIFSTVRHLSQPFIQTPRALDKKRQTYAFTYCLPLFYPMRLCFLLI